MFQSEYESNGFGWKPVSFLLENARKSRIQRYRFGASSLTVRLKVA